MRTPHFPVFLDLRGRRVLVVGGGLVAERKVRGLAKCGARVKVVAPEARPSLTQIAERVVLRPFAITDLEGMWLVVVATDDEALNRRVATACRRRRVMVNTVDRPALCDFIMPSIARRGRLTLAVSTGGASPALARALRRRLQRSLTAKDVAVASTLARLRPRLLNLPISKRRRAIADLMETR